MHAAAENAPQTVHVADDMAMAQSARAEDPLLERLELLRKRGDFSEFVDTALAADSEPTIGPVLRLAQTEALLSVGRSHEAARVGLDAAESALVVQDFITGGQALKLAATARLRSREPLDDALFAELLAKLPADDVNALMLRFWQESLGDRVAYRMDGAANSHPVVMSTASSAPGSVPDALRAISARAGGVAMPTVFIDTGTQHTLMTSEAARAAGVRVGTSTLQLVGFAGVVARPGLVDKLELGGLTLYDVPVLVGDTRPLSALGAQMALGIELMHHVRFTIDYPGRRVFAEPAAASRSRPARPFAWQVPLWTFSQACLAQGQLGDGRRARVLVDTGDRAGTFVSSRWARHNLPRYQRPGSGMVFKFKQRDLSIDALELGNVFLHDWPVVDTIPGALARLDVVDVLVGHDFLSPYQVTIDLHERILLLSGGGAVAITADRFSDRKPATARGSED